MERFNVCPILANQLLILKNYKTNLHELEGSQMATTLFVQIRCRPGTAYNVADEIGLREIHSELYSISGDFDLLLKLRVPSGEDIGRYINDNLLNIEGIERTNTIQTYKVFTR